MGAARLDIRGPFDGEAHLLAALRAGEDAAFQHMVRAYGQRLLAVARAIVRHEADAEDVLQDAFLSAFRGLPAFTGGARIGTWLHRITVNAALMKLRAQRCRSLPPAPARYPGDPAREAAAPDEPVLDRIICRELEELVRLHIDAIREPHRTILRLRDLEQRSTAETARILGCSRQAVKTRLHRARRALRRALEPGRPAAARTA